MDRDAAIIRALGGACNGQSIGWVAPNNWAGSEAFRVAVSRTVGAHKITRTVGRESITTPAGGALRIVTPRSSRGHSFDHIYVHATVTEQELDNIMPLIAATKGSINYYK